jgi:hypothetical protein
LTRLRLQMATPPKAKGAGGSIPLEVDCEHVACRSMLDVLNRSLKSKEPLQAPTPSHKPSAASPGERHGVLDP